MKNTHKITLLGILSSLAIVLSIVESFIPSVGIPGVKLGLANILVLVTLYELGTKEAIIVNSIRVFLSSVLRGTLFSMNFLMSLSGAFFSLLMMIIFYKCFKKFSIIGVSVIGSIFHITGQVLVAMMFLETGYIIYYLPFIGISAIITGIFVGFISLAIIKTGIIKKQRDKYNF